jgi:hypothetical protein
LTWTQTIFQILGLQSLLATLIPSEEFDYATLNGQLYCAIVMKQRSHYLALAIKNREDKIPDGLIDWAKQLRPESLHKNPRFQTQ